MNNLSRPALAVSRRFRTAPSILWAISLAAVLLLSSLWTYFITFSGFAPWDDEGYLMFSIRYFLRGSRLYNDVYAQYGPFYYLAQWIYFGLLGQPVTHDLTRLFSGLLSLASAALLAWCVLRLTKSWVITAFAYFAILKTLSTFALEAGHPEGICLFLVACLLVLCAGINTKLSVAAASTLGFLVAAIALVKINAGFYVGLALLLALSKTAPFGRWKQALFWTAGSFSLLAIVLVMAPLFRQPWDSHLCILLVLSASAVLIAAAVTPLATDAGLLSLITVLTSCALSAICILLPFLLRGTTLYAFLWMTILQYTGFARNWYYPLPCGLFPVLLSLASLVFAILWLQHRRSANPNQQTIFYVQLVKGVLGISGLVVVCLKPNAFMLNPELFKGLTPFLWMVLIQPQEEQASKSRFARLSLCLLAVYLTLYVFPVAGAQVGFSLAIILVVASIFVNDAWVALPPDFFPAAFRKLAFTGLLAVVFLLFARTTLHARGSYRSLEPLALPGATHIRLDKSDRETYRWLADELNTRCDTSFSMPGIFSLYFWSNSKPPSLLITSNWIGLMNSRQQQAVVDDLSKFEHSCIVYSPSLVEFWRRGQDLSQSPLARFTKQNFASAGDRGGYYLLVRKSE